MKKILLLLIILSLKIPAMAQHDAAQPGIALSAGPELNIPQRSIYNIGYGISGKFEVPVYSAFSLTLSGGYTQMVHKNSLLGGSNFSNDDKFIPLKAGIKYYPDNRLYTEVELGSAMEQNNTEKKLFVYSLGTGFLFPLENRKTAIDVGIRYESWSRNRLQQLAVRVAFRLGGAIGE